MVIHKSEKEKNTETLLLTENYSLVTGGRDTAPLSNVLVIGGAGEDKIFSFIAPNILQASGSYVITDVSGSLHERYGKFLEHRGYEVRCLNLIDPEKGCHYDPLRCARSINDVKRLARMLVTNIPSKTESPSVARAEEKLAAALIAYVNYHMFRGTRVIPALRDLFANGGPDVIKESLDNTFRAFSYDDPVAYAGSLYEVYSAETPKETQLAAIDSLLRRLRTIGTDKLRYIMQENDIRFDTVWKRKTALFVITPPHPVPEGFLVSVLYSQIFDAMQYERKTGGPDRFPVHTTFIMDHFAGFGKIPELYGKLRMLPACRATAVAMLRSPQTLKTIYGDTADWPHLTEECFETKVLLGGLDTFSMNWLSMHHLADVPANLRPFIMISNPVAAVLTPEAVYIDAKYRAADHPNKDEAAWCREL